MHEVEGAFRAMNTDVRVVIVATPDRLLEAVSAIDGVRALFSEVETALSRFLPESELSSMNRSAGAPFKASPLLFTVVAEALRAAEATDGLYDPTVLGALVEAGYDRSFEMMDATPERTVPGEAPFLAFHQGGQLGAHRYSWRDVRLDPTAHTIVQPRGCAIDLGGIGKGWTVDRAAERLAAFCGFVVDAGGDLRIRGTQADGSLWAVGVEDPFDRDRDIAVLAARDCAVATSSITRRCWRRNGETRHHLIDPRTGRPSESGAAAATVSAPTAARAETLTKAALLLGPHAGARFLDTQPDAAGMLVAADGRVVASSRFPEGAICALKP